MLLCKTNMAYKFENYSLHNSCWATSNGSWRGLHQMVVEGFAQLLQKGTWALSWNFLLHPKATVAYQGPLALKRHSSQFPMWTFHFVLDTTFSSGCWHWLYAYSWLESQKYLALDNRGSCMSNFIHIISMIHWQVQDFKFGDPWFACSCISLAICI